MIAALAACLADGAAREDLEHAAWRTPWALRLVPAERCAPMTRARLTIAAFLDPIDGWGEVGGLRELLAWVSVPVVVGGPIVALRHEIQAALKERTGASDV